ncbi:CDP-glycerol glycerophosphotransferase family protein [Shewanella sp. 10N.286.45.A1]|uniref:CDP-glycerol glycerophosphotransferase family protein n=1 Tax=Shewanella sp. 10N.286.45.A1 TaxID=3229694 RepID=UPI00354E04FF
MSYPNIINISAMEDVYGLLDCVDLLISDYSSLFIDVLPLNVPINFYRFDKTIINKTAATCITTPAQWPISALKALRLQGNG